MGFIIFFPYSQRRKAPLQVTTSNTFVEQAWQEFTMLRYVKARHMSCRKLTAPWIDQAQTYYLDSIRSNWRSAGLLYYYSFLNLAKALLVGKRKFTYKSLDSTAIHHGLSAALQDISSLANYQIQIYPPLLHGRNNVFSNFYEVVTGSKWAYQDAITIKLQDILGYCEDISIESQNLFNIARKAIDVQSLYREIGNTAWFEMVVHKSKTEVVKAELSNWDLQFLGFDQINHHDRQDWMDAFQKPNQVLLNLTFVRSSPKHFDQSNRQEVIELLWQEARQNLESYIVAPVYPADPRDHGWSFIPKSELAGKCIPWHPVLSNYLVSFALATILRYQPQLLKVGSNNYFYAQAWCSQCARTTLGHFLMLFTDPPLTLKIN